jgi:hypothetical protein
VRELAIAGARYIAAEPPTEEQRTMLLERLAESFIKPETAGIDWDLLRDGKLRAWPIRQLGRLGRAAAPRRYLSLVTRLP